ncbi:hypothetical protein GH714_001142 [Hevea brasiliensis]|uniref:C2 domain-containing protein n=1 Tax=Hevea brasiliensis TaxID=3981 RepID=A0A6A6M9N4_HEVBR|nr:hypothetical protein GH714_001142 [Hevea brasiliensis]
MKSKDGRGTTDAYCVAKYWQKWVRTTTVIDSLAPKWNEQYYWDVYDPYTVITIGIFDNSYLGADDNINGGTKDPRIGKTSTSHGYQTKVAHAETAHPDELDEEFDPFPTSKAGEVVKKRYDKLRSMAGRLMTMMGDLATQLERVHSVLSWRDPRATLMFLVFCVIGGFVVYLYSLRYLIILMGTYVMRPTRMRAKLPSLPQNFLRRLPAKTDTML